jgi:predicted  nucleic acid-binding Zn-ribbon protein
MEPVSPEDGVASLEEDARELHGLRERVASLELNIRQFHAEARAEVSAVRQDLQGAVQILRAEIRAGDAETRRYLRVLHEEVLSRIAGIHRRGG